MIKSLPWLAFVLRGLILTGYGELQRVVGTASKEKQPQTESMFFKFGVGHSLCENVIRKYVDLKIG